MTIGAFFIAILSSNALLGLVQFLITRHFDNKDVTSKTLAAVSYAVLADKLERALSAGFTTKEQRRDVQVLWQAYKANHWNGDMDSRISKFYNLPIKTLEDVYGRWEDRHEKD